MGGANTKSPIRGLIVRKVFVLLFFALALKAGVFNQNAVLSPQVSAKIEQISSELEAKTGIKTHVYVSDTLGEQTPNSLLKSLNLKSPYAIIILSKALMAKDGKTYPFVGIFASDDVSGLFDKDQILSPFPERGTILPILASNKSKDVYNAAILNGYADLAEQIAKSRGISLENGVGNANKTFLNLIRYFVYASIIAVLFVMIKKGVRREQK